MDPLLLAFVAVAALLTVTPGADTALVVGASAGSGARAGATCAAGVVAGLLAWGVASAVGLAALLAAFPGVLWGLRLAGAAYLVLLGASMLRRGARPRIESGEPEASRRAIRGGTLALFGQGLLTNGLNPKIVLFYSTVLPQFLAPGSDVLVRSLILAGIHGALSAVWLGGCAVLAARVGAALRPAATSAVERLSGGVLMGLGVGVALPGHRPGG